MRAWNIDLVHAHDARSHALAMIALIGRKEMPLIVTRRVAFTPRSVKLKYGPRVNRFIAISNAVKQAMIIAGIKESRISVVHSGVAQRCEAVIARDWRAELGWPQQVIVCGIVGAMTGEKGIDLLAAIGSALSPDSQKKIRIVLLGGHKNAISEAGGVTIFSAGFVSEIDPAVAGLDILLHPSRTEGLGTAVIDAMALGVPPVAFAVGGLPEVIDDEVSGILVPAGDAAAFAKQLARLAGDPRLRARLAEGARERAKSFDAARMTKETEAVYDEIIPG